MIFTVQSKNTVSSDGEIPVGASFSYSNTYNKGTVCTDDVASLKLTNLGGITVETVRINVHSNKSGGAGTITVKADDTILATKSGSFKDWVGAFDNENNHAISVLNSASSGVRSLEIQVKGTENSLYIQSFEITYQPAPPRTVTLRNGAYVYGVLTEKSSGAGVVLPSLPDTAEWYFMGWSEVHFYERYTRPNTLPVATVYHPLSDRTLWAVYTATPMTEDKYVTDLESGVYMYVNTYYGISMSGVPENGYIGNAATFANDDNQYYAFSFTASLDTAYITHVATEIPIGYEGTRLAANSSPWLVYHKNEETLFYTLIGETPWVLWLSLYDPTNTYLVGGLMEAEDVTVGSPMRLLIPGMVGETAYTCRPEYPLPVVRPEAEALHETVVPFGIYEWHIVNGKKYLKIK